MRIECIAIGSELLTTKRLDTNSVWIAERLAGLGLGLHRKTAVGDHREDLAELFQEAFHRSDVIICTGGLGPTFDDFTKEVWADTFGVELVEDAECRADIQQRYLSSGMCDGRPWPVGSRGLFTRHEQQVIVLDMPSVMLRVIRS